MASDDALITIENASIARDAREVRRFCLRTIGKFERGEASLAEAQTIARLSEAVMRAMNIEVLTGPRMPHEDRLQELEHEKE